MRTLLGIGIFICLFLHFYSRGDKTHTEVDTLSMIQSAATEVPEQKALVRAEVRSPEKKNISIQKTVEKSDFSTETEVDDTDYIAEDMAQIPWSEIEEGWRAHLKEFLISNDPFKGEEMFAAYLGLTQKYSQRVDYVEDYEEGASEDTLDEDPLAGLDENSYDPEASHKNSLREIFGELYPQVEALHQEYVESIQYLNRTSAEISISL